MNNDQAKAFTGLNILFRTDLIDQVTAGYSFRRFRESLNLSSVMLKYPIICVIGVYCA
ncbi:MAG: hypothetical protein LBF83_01645 [Spirochaetaceae bacterium]|jgi:hypothetical protein|nr:hypothetical protein [Spirochaetaceae bacterium]